MAEVISNRARAQWHPEGIYLNTASFGLPPDAGWDALQVALEEWRAGRTSWEHWGEATERARLAFAELCSVPAEWLAVGANVSTMVGTVAASLPDGARVLSTEPEFTSALWPFMAQGRGIEVRCVAPAELAGAIDSEIDLVSFSAVQSSSGELADLAGIAAAAEAHDALTVVDATQACGWLPLRADASTCWCARPTSGSAHRAARRS